MFTAASCAEDPGFEGDAQSEEADSVEAEPVEHVEQAVTGVDRGTDRAIAPRFPAVVSVGTAGGACTGTLISPRHVLSAKHCGTGVSVTLEAVVGAGTAPLERRVYPIVRTYPHPSSDITVYELGRAINRFAPSGEPSYGVAPLGISTWLGTGSSAVSVGYGETRGLKPNGACNYIYGTRRWLSFFGRWTITDTDIGQPSLHCADRNFRGNDPGDSGGPLIDTSSRVVGVFSGWSGGLAHWARINPQVADWIRRITASSRLREHGWVRTSSSTTPAPEAGRSFNSSGFANSVVRSGVGQYTVTMRALGGPGGNVQVSSLGTDATRCKVTSWFGSLDLTVAVACHRPSGAAADSRFVVSFERGAERGAYVWANEPATASYTPSLAYSLGSAGGSFVVQRSAQGQYQVRIPQVAPARRNGGNVLVTAYGSDAAHCKVGSWGASGADIMAQVRCFSTAGLPADSRFTLSYTDASVPSPYGWGAYAWASVTSSARYDLIGYMFTSSVGLSGIGAEGARPFAGNELDARGALRVGRYWITYPHQTPSEAGNSSAVLSTAYGNGNAYCKLRDWTGPHVTAYTACFDASGSPVASAYVNRLLYSGVRLF